MLRMKSVTLEGFKSFASQAPTPEQFPLPGKGEATNCLRLGDVTVLIGANGAGKSVVTSFFRMVNFMTTGALRTYVGRSGGANSILHFGMKRTPIMRASLLFEDSESPAETQYAFTLAGAARDTMIFTEESIKFQRADRTKSQLVELGAGHAEPLVLQETTEGEGTRRVVFGMLSRCRAYQFHDTSEEARVRLGGYVGDSRFLKSDAGNLAAYLYALRRDPDRKSFYDQIVATVQLAFPQFGDFDLESSPENGQTILLNWRLRNDPDYLLGPHQFSDGSLRFIALATLLLQPADSLPSLIVLDEPELGLHPAAISLLGELIAGVSLNAQVLVATQSPQLVDHFDLSQIRPIVLLGDRSVFLDLDPQAYTDWLEEYSTGELWQKNVIFGGPANG